LRKGVIQVNQGELRGIMDTFYGYGWGLIKIKKVGGIKKGLV